MLTQLEDSMKLWLLRPLDDLPEDDNPWEPWYDKAFGFVVRAETEDEARVISATEGGDENRARRSPTGSPWLDPCLSSCIELAPGGEAGVVIMDFCAA
jgi:hypothetical protein